VFQIVVCAAALAWTPIQSGWSNVGDAPAPREAFTPDVDPAAIPKRPEPAIIDEAEFRVVTPLLTNDAFANRTRLFLDGWFSQSYNFNPYLPPQDANGPVGYLDEANEYQPNQLYLRLGRTLDPTRDRFDLGGQVDLLYGTDAEYFQSFGLDRKIILDHHYIRMAIPQAYVATFVPLGDGLTLKAGKFYSPLGIDVPTAVGGFFPTKPYSRLYGEPFTLTGVVASQAIGEQIAVLGGVVRGWDQWTDANNGLTGLAGVSWRSCDRWTRVSVAGLGGPEHDEPHSTFQGITVAPGLNANRWLLVATLERRLTEKLRCWTQGDWGMQERATSAGAADWYGVQQGFAFAFNDCVTVGLRGEWFRDDDGTRVVTRRQSRAQAWTTTPADYFTLSLGAQIRMNLWMTIRPEIRYDWQARDDPTALKAFDGGERGQQFLGVVDFVVRF
jgi:hypothetical protein